MKKIIKLFRRMSYLSMAAFGLYFLIRRMSEKGLLVPAHKSVEKNNPTKEIDNSIEIKFKSSIESQPSQIDNLKKIEGIGPKIEKMLHENGIKTYKQLATQTSAELETLIKVAGIRIASPQSWPIQASYAAKGEWQELADYQATLKGGRIVE
jgi:predicted flap endonuclease-1-like 5' DNA nuclease